MTGQLRKTGRKSVLFCVLALMMLTLISCGNQSAESAGAGSTAAENGSAESGKDGAAGTETGEEENGEDAEEDSAPEENWTEEDITIELPGISREYTFVCVNDIHIINGTAGVTEDEMENVNGRIRGFVNYNGVPSADLWKEMAPQLDSYGADGILFIGDMVDFYSDDNLAALKEGLDQVKTPYMYLRADHDLAFSYRGYSDEEKKVEGKKRNEAEDALCDNAWIQTMEYEDFALVGFNRSTSQLAESGANALKAFDHKGKPVILISHVPFQSLLDDKLDEASREVWGARSLIWGYRDAYYVPDKNTDVLMQYIYDEESPVYGIVAGHLHFPFTGNVTEHCVQHVLPASFTGVVTILHVVPE